MIFGAGKLLPLVPWRTQSCGTGLPRAKSLLTGGEASDARHFNILLDIGPNIRPRATL